MKTPALTQSGTLHRPRRRLQQAKRALRDVLVGPLSIKQMAVLCRELRATEHAGIPPLQSLRIIADNAGGLRLRRLLKHMAEQIRRGASFSDAVEWHKGRFPVFFREMVAAAEASGRLASAFEYLAEFYEQHLKVRRAALAAATYPMMIVLAMVVLIPILQAFLANMAGVADNDMQAIVLEKLLRLAIFCAEIWLIVRLRIPQALWSLFGGQVPFFGRIARALAMSRFFQCLAMLLESGLGAPRSIEHAARVAGNIPIKLSLTPAADRVRKGASLTEALSPSPFFTETMRVMLEVGERSGKVDQVLRKLSQYAQEEAKFRLRIMVASLESILILIIAGIIPLDFVLVLAFGGTIALSIAALLKSIKMRRGRVDRAVL